LFYNLLANINLVPANNSNAEDSYTIKHTDTWASISFNYYNTMDLWWLVCAYNQVKNPTTIPAPGTVIKLLKATYVSTVIDQLNTQISE
jgi:nucleoid-associated protein YgaU